MGATLGTAPYMPPEQIHGLEIDPRADLFAVGATMFRLITKRRVHEAETETEILVKMATQPAPPWPPSRPTCPRGVGLVVDRALQFDREHRYPDALTMQSDVRAVREGKPPPYAAAQAPAAVAPAQAQAAPSPGHVDSMIFEALTRAAAAQPLPPPAAPMASPSAASDALTHGASGVVVAAGAAVSGLDPTAWGGSGAPATMAGPATVAASPVAIHASPSVAQPPASVAFPPSAAAYPPSMANPPAPVSRTAVAAAPAASGPGGTMLMPGAAAAAAPPLQGRAQKRDAAAVPILVAGGVVATCLIALVLWLALRGGGSDASIVTPGAAVTVPNMTVRPPGAQPPATPRDSDILPEHDHEPGPHGASQPHNPAPPPPHMGPSPQPAFPQQGPQGPPGGPGKGHGKGHG